MKHFIILIIAILLAACVGSKDFDKLKTNLDKLQEVEVKVGKPDRIERKVFMGATIEKWVYEKDSIMLIFENDILTNIHHRTRTEIMQQLLMDSIPMETINIEKIDLTPPPSIEDDNELKNK